MEFLRGGLGGKVGGQDLGLDTDNSLEFRGILRRFHHPKLGLGNTREGFHEVTIEQLALYQKGTLLETWHFSGERDDKIVTVSHGICSNFAGSPM